MIAEKTITICGKDVQMRYCAATETGYELLSGNSSTVFVPTAAETDADGKVVRYDPPKATTDDFIKLALAAVIAAYERKGENVPISASDILYDAEPDEVTNLIASVIELRKKWYTTPKTIPDSEFEGDEKQKNAQPPANDSSNS